MDIIWINGDGTVPLESQKYHIDNAIQYNVNGVEHAKEYSNEKVITIVKSILDEKNPPSNYETPLLNGASFNLDCPTELHIYDSSGNHAGPINRSTNDTENNIELSQYVIIGENKIAYIPNVDKYKIIINTTENAIANLKIDLYNNSTIGKTIIYDYIPMTNITTVEMEYFGGMNDYTLKVDGNSDGVFDSYIEPTAIFNANSLNSSIISIGGKLGENDWYISDVNISIVSVFQS